MLRIENQAIVFALLCKYTVETEGEKGREVIQKGMIRYGRERGARMAARAKANGDPIALWTNQAYGEWKPDYEGQMEFGYDETEPTLKSYISKCAWCDAWNKYGLLEYGREYCVNVPLRYNNDKQKKPLFSRGLSVCRLLFNSFSKLKIDENYKEKRRLFY